MSRLKIKLFFVREKRNSTQLRLKNFWGLPNSGPRPGIPLVSLLYILKANFSTFTSLKLQFWHTSRTLGTFWCLQKRVLRLLDAFIQVMLDDTCASIVYETRFLEELVEESKV